jgi:hypothetical protein
VNNNSFQRNKYSDKCEQDKKYFQEKVYQNQNKIKETPVLFNSVPSEHLHGEHHEDKYKGIKIDRVNNI